MERVFARHVDELQELRQESEQLQLSFAPQTSGTLVLRLQEEVRLLDLTIHAEDDSEICVFLDVGTNGELVVGNRDFLLAGSGAAGPALEGGVVHTGMRAEEGAVDRVTTENGRLKAHVIGGGAAKGICGSGIVDLIAELYLNGWVDLRGRFREDAPGVVHLPGREEDELEAAVEYAPGLYFYQGDMDEFLKTKAAAMTMVEYMMNLIGLTLEEVGRFYVAGAFGTHIDKEAAVTIGLYPDMDREKIISPGNTSLKGATGR